MSKLVSNSDGIFVPEHTTHSQPKNVNRRNILSAIGAAGAGIALPSAVGLALSAPGQALAAVSPAGKLIFSTSISKEFVGFVSKETFYEWWYVASNAWKQKQVQGYLKTMEKASAASTITKYYEKGLARNVSTGGILIESSNGIDILSISSTDLSSNYGTCRRLNADGAENLDTNYNSKKVGWTNYSVVKCSALGSAAVEFLYKTYRDDNGKTWYRLFGRVAGSGGLLVTGLILFSGGKSEDVAAVNAFIKAMSDLKTAKQTFVATGLTSAASTAVGVAYGAAIAVGADVWTTTGTAALAAVGFGGAATGIYYTITQKFIEMRSSLAHFSTYDVDDIIDCR